MKTTKEKIAIMQGCNDDFSNLEIRLVSEPLRSDWMPYNLRYEPVWDWADVDYRLTPPAPKVHKVYMYLVRCNSGSMVTYSSLCPLSLSSLAGVLLAMKEIEITEGEGGL